VESELEKKYSSSKMGFHSKSSSETDIISTTKDQKGKSPIISTITITTTKIDKFPELIQKCNEKFKRIEEYELEFASQLTKNALIPNIQILYQEKVLYQEINDLVHRYALDSLESIIKEHLNKIEKQILSLMSAQELIMTQKLKDISLLRQKNEFEFNQKYFSNTKIKALNTIVCPFCGADIPKFALYCPECGHLLVIMN
jgi:hypothetical protein